MNDKKRFLEDGGNWDGFFSSHKKLLETIEGVNSFDLDLQYEKKQYNQFIYDNCQADYDYKIRCTCRKCNGNEDIFIPGNYGTVDVFKKDAIATIREYSSQAGGYRYYASYLCDKCKEVKSEISFENIIGPIQIIE